MEEPKRLTKKPVVFTQVGGAVGHLYETQYTDGQTAILAYDSPYEPIATISVNLAGYGIRAPEGSFFVKLYSEGLLVNDDVFATGLFEKVDPTIQIGYGKFQLWKIKGR